MSIVFGQLSVYSDHLVKQVVATQVEPSRICSRLLYMEIYCDPSLFVVFFPPPTSPASL